MYLLDTNILYLLSKIETNQRYNLSKIRNMCFLNRCAINIYSIFEIFNNQNRTDEEIKKIINTLKERRISIFSNDIMSHYLGSTTLVLSWENRKNICDKLFDGILPFYSHLFGILSSFNFFIMYLLNGEKENDNEYFKRLAKFIGDSLPVVERHINNKLKKDYENGLFVERNLKMLYDTLLSSYFFAILCTDETYNKTHKKFDNYDEYFNLLLNQIEQDDFLNVNIRFVMKGSYGQEKPISINMFQTAFRQRFPTKDDAECFFDDMVNMMQQGSSQEEKTWLRYMLKNLLYDEAFLKSNNFIDFLIIRDFLLSANITHLITCDVGMQKVMKLLNFNEKISNSLDVISSLKVDK